MSRSFEVAGFSRPLLAPRYGDMLAIAKMAHASHVAHPYPTRPTVAEVVDHAIATLPLWLAVIRSAYPQAGIDDEEVEIWMTDQGYSLHEIISIGSGILQEYRVRLGFIAPEVVQSHADFTPPSQDAPTTC